MVKSGGILAIASLALACGTEPRPVEHPPNALPPEATDIAASPADALAAVEQRLAAAPLRVTGMIRVTGPDIREELSVIAEVAPNNALHIEVEGLIDNNPVRHSFQSDGRTQSTEEPAPADLHDRFAAGLVRAGLHHQARDVLRERGITPPPVIADPRAARAETAGFDVDVEGERWAVELEIDPDTGLPRARRAMRSIAGGVVTIEESYIIQTDVTLARRFELASSCDLDEACLLALCTPELAVGCEYLGIALYYGLGREADPERGLTYFRTGCVHGHAPSCAHASAAAWKAGDRESAAEMQRRSTEQITLGLRSPEGYTRLRLARLLCAHGRSEWCRTYAVALEEYDPTRAAALQGE